MLLENEINKKEYDNYINHEIYLQKVRKTTLSCIWNIFIFFQDFSFFYHTCLFPLKYTSDLVCVNFSTKTTMANFLLYFFKQIRVSVPGRVPINLTFFQASRYRQFLP